MTDKEIMKALECCGDEEMLKWCTDCPYFDKENDFCQEDLSRDALDLINRQQAEIEKYRKLDELAEKCIENQKLEIKQLEGDILEEKLNYSHIKELYEEEKAKVEKAKQKVINSCKMLKTARAEVIKEFADRLKNVWFDNHFDSPDIDFDYFVDNLVKEMVEGENDRF